MIVPHSGCYVYVKLFILSSRIRCLLPVIIVVIGSDMSTNDKFEEIRKVHVDKLTSTCCANNVGAGCCFFY